MLRFLSRMMLVAASSLVVVPYTAAILCHLLYGRQAFHRSLKRTLHPRHVYALNRVFLQSLATRVRFTPLFLHWTNYYKTADPSLLIKNLAYGRNNCCLDLHLPKSHRLTSPPTRHDPRPVVVFIYGGAWSSGDKSMYGALSGQIAESLDALVCCPNYSTFPHGCVDDMIQDIVDCIQWIHDSIQDYGGDKNKLMLIGHSAGAHLGAMSILELLHDQRAHGTAQPNQASSIQFHDSYYSRMASDPGNQEAGEALEESSGSSESFALVSENGNGEAHGEKMEASIDSTTVSMVEVSEVDLSVDEPGQKRTLGTEEGVAADTVSEAQALIRDTGAAVEETAGAGGESGGEGKAGGEEVKGPVGKSGGDADGEEESCEEEDDNDSVVTVRPKDIERHATLIDLCASIKAFIGLGGVYHIGDHFEHESKRGVDEYSSMTPAMYGPDHFDRFSPTSILKSLDAPISLPRMVLVHGTEDYVVPVTASQKMAEALASVYADVSLRIVPGCDHYEDPAGPFPESKHLPGPGRSSGRFV